MLRAVIEPVIKIFLVLRAEFRQMEGDVVESVFAGIGLDLLETGVNVSNQLVRRFGLFFEKIKLGELNRFRHRFDRGPETRRESNFTGGILVTVIR